MGFLEVSKYVPKKIKAKLIAAPGAPIPYMENHYHIGSAIVTLIFVGTALGFIIAAFFTNMILGRLGRAKSLTFVELLMLAVYIMLVATL